MKKFIFFLIEACQSHSAWLMMICKIWSGIPSWVSVSVEETKAFPHSLGTALSWSSSAYFSVLCISWKLAAGSREFTRLRDSIPPLGKSIGGGVFFHQMAHDVWFALL